MIVLPNGQVLFNDGASNQLYAYTPAGSANPAYLPVIQKVSHGEHGLYVLTGTQLNGPSDASAYGDDVQSNENFPIVRLQSSAGLVFYCRSQKLDLDRRQRRAGKRELHAQPGGHAR